MQHLRLYLMQFLRFKVISVASLPLAHYILGSMETNYDNSQIPEEYLNDDFDFGFTSVDADELNTIMNSSSIATRTIRKLQSKLDLVLEMTPHVKVRVRSRINMMN